MVMLTVDRMEPIARSVTKAKLAVMLQQQCFTVLCIMSCINHSEEGRRSL